MISFNYENDFELTNESDFINWIEKVILSENKKLGEISYIFCDDDYLLEINKEHLNHDDLTDIISFDYSLGNELSGDIFISTERVLDNSKEYNVSLETKGSSDSDLICLSLVDEIVKFTNRGIED